MPFAKRPLMVATEERLVEFHIFRIGFVPDSAAPNSLPFVFADIEGFAMRASHGFEVILGMNVLSQCDLIINRDHAWSVTFG